jgi:hypothetical protein
MNEFPDTVPAHLRIATLQAAPGYNWPIRDIGLGLVRSRPPTAPNARPRNLPFGVAILLAVVLAGWAALTSSGGLFINLAVMASLCAAVALHALFVVLFCPYEVHVSNEGLNVRFTFVPDLWAGRQLSQSRVACCVARFRCRYRDPQSPQAILGVPVSRIQT